MTEPAPLTPEQQRALSEATERAGKINGAARVATFNGWTIGVFAAIGILFGVVSLTALVMGVGMAVVAWNEFRGRAMLRQFDTRGPQLLGRNQLGFLALITAYCLWSIYQAVHNPITDVAGLEAIGDSVGSLVTEVTVAVYAGVIVLSLLFQGLNARYYFARTQIVKDYVKQTPEWVLDLQRSSVMQ